jgi:hypothetical protein
MMTNPEQAEWQAKVAKAMEYLTEKEEPAILSVDESGAIWESIAFLHSACEKMAAFLKPIMPPEVAEEVEEDLEVVKEHHENYY